MTQNPVKLFGSATEFATFGNSTIAYVRKVRSDDMNRRYPLSMELPDGIELWGLFGADGEPIALADEQSELYVDAEERDLLAVQRH